MKTVLALYDDPETAERGVDALKRSGVSTEHITVVSSEPLEMFAFGRDEGRTWMPWLAALAGMIGGTFGYGLTSTAQRLWPLETGGMPIVGLWTNGIIVYELTMLGAIVATLCTFLASARLLTRRPSFYDPLVSEGKILVVVTNLGGVSSETLDRRLREIGGTVSTHGHGT